MLRYSDLTKNAGKKVWELFIGNVNISQGSANISVAELKFLVNCKLNSRQVSTPVPYFLLLGLHSALDQECYGYSACFGYKGEESGLFLSHSKDSYCKQGVHHRVQWRGRGESLIPLA